MAEPIQLKFLFAQNYKTLSSTFFDFRKLENSLKTIANPQISKEKMLKDGATIKS